MTTLAERSKRFRSYVEAWKGLNVKTKVFDKIEGATTFVTTRTGDITTTKKFNDVAAGTQRTGKIPDGINSFLMQHGLNADAMFAAGQKFTVAQVDQHFATRDAAPADRMSVKSCLRQLNLLAE